MGFFGAVFGRRGDAGFIGPLLGASSGVGGFNVAMFPRPVRDIVRPALPGVWVRARKSSPYVLTMAQNWRLMARRASLLRRAPGSRAHLLAVLTLQCAAKPYGWLGGQPAQTTTYRVNMRIKGPRHPPTGPRNPPIGLTCA